MLPVFCASIIVYPLSGMSPSVHAAAESLEYTTVDVLTLVPPHIEEISRDPALLRFLSGKLRALFWAGGDISAAAGNTISDHIRLFTALGSTEMGMWPTLHPSGHWPLAHWKYMHVHPSMHVDFRFQSDHLYEAYIKKSLVQEEEQPVFKVFPHLQEYSSGDLFSPHPSEPHLWQYHGRADDMLVFASGEKFHPAAVENHIVQHPEVEEALLVGTRRPQAALLVAMRVEIPLASPEERKEAIERLWPTIKESNETCPAYAELTEGHILFVSPQKPLMKTAKGTIQRSSTERLYNQELDQLFEEAAKSPAPRTAHSPITGGTDH